MTIKALDKYAVSSLSLAGLNISFKQTCRVPAGELNSLPAGLGSFPIFKVSDFKSGSPDNWRIDAYFMPMYRQEAMWLSFDRGYHQQSSAVIVGAGNINAVTGKPFDPNAKTIGSSLDIKLEKEQNYMVVPPQPWLDGWKAEDGEIYQFVAAELGSGETVEGQITDKETVGGVQIIVYNPLPGKDLIPKTRPREYIIGGGWESMNDSNDLNENPIFMPKLKWPPNWHDHPMYKDQHQRIKGAATAQILSAHVQSVRQPQIAYLRRLNTVQSMGLGRGGEISQKIYPDPYGAEVWQQTPNAVELIYLVSSNDFKQVTGRNPPPTPVTYKAYQQQGLPWFELHDQKLADTKGSEVFGKLKPVGEGKANIVSATKSADKEDKNLLDKLQPQ